MHIRDDFIDKETTIIDEHEEFMVYAESRCGPWAITFERGHEGGEHIQRRPTNLRLKGPFIENSNRDYQILEGFYATPEEGDDWIRLTNVLKQMGGWQYVEMGSNDGPFEYHDW